MSDYNGKVYRKQGGDELVVAHGGQIVVQGGGNIHLHGENVAELLALLSVIPDTDQEDSETIWNDEGVLKVSSAGGG